MFRRVFSIKCFLSIRLVHPNLLGLLFPLSYPNHAQQDTTLSPYLNIFEKKDRYRDSTASVNTTTLFTLRLNQCFSTLQCRLVVL